ncbi:hypothetical protein FJT64_007668 [Amphibalanus amphitrite]|uniref:Uncharacterized protein n=1 Tax=Amphibalanus amphitrite TaxID=1232801 RepID=A0A6A4VSW5_AMPAM|nr:hypothetical protein FJT64_007668 [Amphibalanus amphitrite]
MHPGDVFLGHFTCSGRHTGQALADQLASFIEERGINADQVLIIGGDGTNSVVGYKGGWMACLEARLGRPLTRVVCLCHQAELPYRALFQTLAGRTLSKGRFEGEIGEMITGAVHERPLAAFRPLGSAADLPAPSPEVERSLSSDMQLLYQCARCVTTGDGSAVEHRIHGQLNMARWYTAQSRLLRAYMSQPAPSAEDDGMVTDRHRRLTTLALYIVAVYLPTVLAIKHKPDLVEAPRHLFDQLQRQRQHMGGPDLQTVQGSLCGNALMAHPENVVLGMLGDERRDVRARAVQMVREARARRQPGPVRQFRVQSASVNVSAHQYTELVDVTMYARVADVEPPCVRFLSDGDLEALVDEPLRTRVPCHTQSTERAVKLTTQSSGAVAGAVRQDGYSLNKIAFRRHFRGQ